MQFQFTLGPVVTRSTRTLIAGCLALLLTATAFAGNTIHVPADFATIQSAIDAASPGGGDEIVVAAGEYHEAIDLLDKSLVLRSEEGPSKTILNGMSFAEQSVITITDGQGPDTIIDGFRIINGSGTLVPVLDGQHLLGGGIYISASSPTIVNCIIENNAADWGGGIYADSPASPHVIGCTLGGNGANMGAAMMFNGATATIDDCLIEDNYANAGGGLVIGPQSYILRNTTFIGNTALTFGGAMLTAGFGSGLIENCMFAANSATDGGAMYITEGGASPVLLGAVFEGNTAERGGAVAVTAASASFHQCSFQNNVASVEGGALAAYFTGTFAVEDGFFCGNSPDDLHGPWTDLGGNTFHDECPDCAPADLDCDGTVGVADLLLLLAAWGRCADCDNCPADLDGNCTVGVADLLILLANWGP